MLPALVLTAGFGTRLDPLTRFVAKPAVPLAGKTLVERVLEGLRAQGVTDVVLNLHHCPETITAVVGDGAHLGLRVRYSWEHPILGSAGGPRRALALLDAETFLVVNGDTLSDVQLASMIDGHRQSGAEVTIAVVPNPRPDHYNGLVLDTEDRVTGFVSKEAPGQKEAPASPFEQARGAPSRGRGAAGPATNWHFIGVQVANAAVFAPLADGLVAETVAGIYRDRVARAPGSIRGWRVTTPFLDVGTPRDYLEAALALANGQPDDSVIEAGASVSASARLVRSVVWPGARVGAGAHLEDCVVAGDVTVPAGFQARGAVIVPAAATRATDDVQMQDGIAVFPMGT